MKFQWAWWLCSHLYSKAQGTRNQRTGPQRRSQRTGEHCWKEESLAVADKERRCLGCQSNQLTTGHTSGLISLWWVCLRRQCLVIKGQNSLWCWGTQLIWKQTNEAFVITDGGFLQVVSQKQLWCSNTMDYNIQSFDWILTIWGETNGRCNGAADSQGKTGWRLGKTADRGEQTPWLAWASDSCQQDPVLISVLGSTYHCYKNFKEENTSWVSKSRMQDNLWTDQTVTEWGKQLTVNHSCCLY